MEEVSFPEGMRHRVHHHVHLEPELRWMMSQGRPLPPKPRSVSEFFDKVGYETNPSWTEESIGQLLRNLHAEEKTDLVSHVDLRVSPRRFLSRHVSLPSLLGKLSNIAEVLENPTVTLILQVNRNSRRDLIEAVTGEVANGLPSAWRGIDLAGNESDTSSQNLFIELYRLAESKGLQRLVHAGEFGGESNVWAALDDLGAQRLGHALPTGAGKSLRSRLVRDGISVEFSLHSNRLLGAWSDLGSHPIKVLLNSEVKFSVNADLPVLTGKRLIDEERLAASLLGCPIGELAARSVQ